VFVSPGVKRRTVIDGLSSDSRMTGAGQSGPSGQVEPGLDSGPLRARGQGRRRVYRNVAFVPSCNDGGRDAAALKGASRDVLAPYGVWWADWASTSDQWISTGWARRHRRSTGSAAR
jgi:hypothetical protein